MRGPKLIHFSRQSSKLSGLCEFVMLNKLIKKNAKDIPKVKYHEIKCETAEEFLDVLSPRNELWKTEAWPNLTWIFRGQANSDWGLIPKVFRVDINWHKKHNYFNRCFSYDKVKAEHQILKLFVAGADRQGIALPGDSFELRKNILHFDYNFDYLKKKEDFDLWPHDCLLPLLACAQHSGLPTRLLDWTKRAYIAAYFAVNSAIEIDDFSHGPDIVVWGLETQLARKQEFDFEFRIVRSPSGFNMNMAMQQGLFTLVKSQKNDVEDRGIEEILYDKNNGISPLKKITLPKKEAYKVYRLLSYEGVDGASLFSGLSGVKKFVYEQAYWDDWDILRRKY